MSSKYNQHPMEAKAEADIAATKIERERVKSSYAAWLEQMGFSGFNQSFEAYRAGYAQGKYDGSTKS